MTAYELALAVCKALDGKNARDIGIIKVEGRSDITDDCVVASGNSVTHVRALGEETEFQLEKAGQFARHKEGLAEGKWIALDYGDVIVHIFYEDVRTFYQLEKLWSDGNNYVMYSALLHDKEAES